MRHSQTVSCSGVLWQRELAIHYSLPTTRSSLLYAMNLKPETLQKIDEVITHYPVRRSAALPLLHLVQEDQGYVSPAAIEWIAKALEQRSDDAALARALSRSSPIAGIRCIRLRPRFHFLHSMHRSFLRIHWSSSSNTLRVWATLK